MTTIILTSLFSFIIGAVISFLFVKQKSVSAHVFSEVQNQLNQIQNELAVKSALLNDKEQKYEQLNTQKENMEVQLQQCSNSSSQLLAKLDMAEKNVAETKTILQNMQSKIDTQQDLVQELNVINSQKQSKISILEEKLNTQKEELEALNEKSLLTFESLANKIFDAKTQDFSKKSKENLDQVLSPLKENLQEFKKKVEDTYDRESKQRFSLEEKIKELVQLNQQISKDATNLTNALKGQAKTQGDWGEMILESILEHSGLVKDREYFTQSSYTDDNGQRKQPDIIIAYPNNRQIIIDSKVSLTAYERFANCDDAEKQKEYLNEHIKSIRNHIDNLSSKDYDKIEKALDFVMLFVPIEPAYMTAIHFDQDLWSYAYKKRILLISPTNLIAALKMVADIWKREHQNQNAMEIAKRGEKLYEKFVGFVTDMRELDKAMQKASHKYQDAFNKLSSGRGNLISQAEQLKQMGLNPKKHLNHEKNVE